MLFADDAWRTPPDRLTDGQISSLYAPPSFSSFGAVSIMCCSARPASSSAPSVLPAYRSGRKYNIRYVNIFCDHIKVLHIFDQFRDQAGALWWVCLVFSFLPSLPHPPTTPSRWPAVTTLPPLAKFQLVWRRLCEAPRSSSSFAGQKHQYLLSRLVGNVENIKFVLPWTWILNNPLYFRTQWVRSQGRSQFEHDDRRRTGRAPQTTASFTQDRRRAHWHT